MMSYPPQHTHTDSSLADNELPQVRLREASQLLQCVVLWHGQAGDVWGKLGKRDAGGVGGGVALLKAQHHSQDVCHTLRHFYKEEGLSVANFNSFMVRQLMERVGNRG